MEPSNEQPSRFHVIPNPSKWAFSDTYVNSNLRRWDLLEGSKICRFRFEKRYHKLAAEEFLVDFFNDETVQATFKVLKAGKEWVSPGRVTGVECEVAGSNLTSLVFYDRLNDCDPQIIRQQGSIMKCIDVMCKGFLVQDMLRDMLLNEDSENVYVYSEEEKKQMLYSLLFHMVLGGPMCQYEDVLEPYVETIKKLYKSLLSVQKNAATGKVEVTSVVYKVAAVQSGDKWSLFPKSSAQNFCYVFVDVARRQCTVWYHAYIPYW
mmetsp:Transcript_2936/g.4950  ORF Transcript_2936/g.4950 Transcript_2936/m.4950 type:complete len:263 (+) Transcript_2936:126-914(+)|eukprot:CAMPEP_0198202396 /NCGR_PEP_ID=MMETSP1445-20131203/5557_1 /TAXON_ID=36898 /ORGANISM="Pyramimonas sp., Strain CCMP2087" /LENGTH=262 /DNA_ID=CAMNT_0043873293 /DNA_START=122 /DNA_END=910 /DNA_ORIENTATION=-